MVTLTYELVRTTGSKSFIEQNVQPCIKKTFKVLTIARAGLHATRPHKMAPREGNGSSTQGMADPEQKLVQIWEVLDFLRYSKIMCFLASSDGRSSQVDVVCSKSRHSKMSLVRHRI